jgi:hypothetical protein
MVILWSVFGLMTICIVGMFIYDIRHTNSKPFFKSWFTK